MDFCLGPHPLYCIRSQLSSNYSQPLRARRGSRSRGLKNGWAIAGASKGEVMVLRRMLAFAMLLSTVSYLGAKTGSIGSVVAHGKLRVDGHAVKGSCTAFEGTVVETGSDGQSDAD